MIRKVKKYLLIKTKVTNNEGLLKKLNKIKKMIFMSEIKILKNTKKQNF
jgi:hypothetical protein